MNLVLLGPPGAGKGTQAKEIARKRKLIQLSTGDMLRAAVAAGTDIGLKARAIMDRGELVADDVVIGIIAERIEEPDCKGGFVLDGFPRTLPQASALDKMLAERKRKLTAVIEFKVDDAALIERISGRFSCTKCGEGYHDRFKPLKHEGVCDVCGHDQFSRRADDKAETVRNRLLAYYRDTSPLIGYYYGKGLLKSLDAMEPIEKVAGDVERMLGPTVKAKSKAAT